MKALWEERYPLVALPETCNEICETCQAFIDGLGCLLQKKLDIGPIAYDKEFLSKPRSNISSLFPSWLMEQNYDMHAVMVQTYSGTWETVTGWDIARSEKIGADFLVGFTLGYDKATRMRHVLNITREKGISFSDQLKMIAEHYARYHDKFIIIEADMNQDLWVEQGKDIYPGLPVYPHFTKGAKKDLQNGVPSLLIPLTNHLYTIPRGDDHSKLMTDIWLGEALSFGWEDDKLEGVGEHDDTIIAWWKAEIGIKRLIGSVIRAGRLNMRGGREI